MRNTRQQIAGFTITELLIATALGLVLISGMISVFIGSKRSSELNTAISDMQESARYALDSMARDVRRAGFQGCVDVNTRSATVRADAPPTLNPKDTIVTGSVVVSPSVWVPAPPRTFLYPSADIVPVPGTHTLALQFGSTPSELSAPMLTQADPIAITDNTDNAQLDDGDLAIIADCDEADLFRVSSAPENAGVITHLAVDNSNNGNLSKAYDGGMDSKEQAQVMKFHSNVYFVADTQETNEHGDPLRSLYVQTLPYTAANPPTELVQGIENFRVRFGVRRNNGSIAYYAANEPGYDSETIETVQIGLLMASYSRIRNENDNQNYVLAGQNIPAAQGQATDGLSHSNNTQHRLVFNTTVKVRNRRFKDGDS